MLNQLASTLRRGSSSRRQQNSNVNVQVMNEGQVMAQIEGQSIGGTLPRELQNLGNNPHIVVNHTYNLHYPTDRPSEQHMQDVAAYGQEYTHAFNERCLELCGVHTTMCLRMSREPTCVVSPVLRDEPYFTGTSGIPKTKIYIPDAKYIKNEVREYSGNEIDLRQLHQGIGPDESQQCRHVALIGNQGCGKTVLCKRYACMVLRKEIPALADVEFVHFMSLPEFLPDNDRYCTINEIMFDRLVNLEPNAYKYGYEWVTRNPEKLLIIFDNADQVLSRFKEQIEPINYSTRTVLYTIIQNILNNHLFRGCRTLICARDWPFKKLFGNSRPQKFVLAGPMSTEHRISLARDLFSTDLMVEDYCSSLLRKFPAGFYFTKDALLLYFAVSSLKWGDETNEVKITTDVMLVVMMLQHLLRSGNASTGLLNTIGKFRLVAFDMVLDGVIRRNHSEMLKYELITYDDLVDVMAVAPQHTIRIDYRLLPNDYSYFFTNQVFQEALAACHIAEMPMPHFTDFVNNHLHTPRWLVVRRFVCGFVLHEDTKRNLAYLVNRPIHGADMEKLLLSSLALQAERMNEMSSYNKLELVGSLYECGAAAKSIIKTHVRSLVLPDTALDPCDLYALSRIGLYIEQLNEVDICLGRDTTIEEYDGIVAIIVRKSVKVRLVLSKLVLTSGHVSGLERPLKELAPNGKLISLNIVACRQTSSAVIKLFNAVSKAVTVEQIDVAEEMIEG